MSPTSPVTDYKASWQALNTMKNPFYSTSKNALAEK